MNSIYELFKDIANKVPYSIAIKFEDKKVTYKELLYKIDCFSTVLAENKVKRGDVVGIILRREPELLALLFSVLKLGAAYLPIEPSFPENRIQHMLNDSNVSLVVVQSNDIFNFKGYKTICIDEMVVTNKSNNYHYDESSKDYSKELAYIIYTSGSTGQPKGVMIRQESVINLIENGTEMVGLLCGKTIACLSNISFDMSVPETILALCKGLTVVLANEQEQKNPALMKNLIINNKVDTLLIAPTRLQFLISYNQDLSFLNCLGTILFGAEVIPQNLFELIRANSNSKIYNLYGPTEITAYATYSDITQKGSIDIGKPIANMDVFIVNDKFERLENGEKGEILISGVGVASGYINNQSLINEKFINNSKLSRGSIYRTGDYGRVLPDGNIEYLGRVDNQIKFKGHRIELEEIESVITKYPNIKQCIVDVVTYGEHGESLCLFFTVYEEIDENILKKHLEKEIPEYMRPTIFIKLEEFPCNHNGKIDRKQLKNMKYSDLNENKITNNNLDINKEVIQIIKKIIAKNCCDTSLGLADIGIDSLAFINIVVEIENVFDIVFDDKMLDYKCFQSISDLINYIASVIDRK